jgi:putative tryptophan/tyrosine transport system substrate-binding protein
MRRREFITLIAGASAAGLPIVARAQRPGMPVVGCLLAGSAERSTPILTAFHQGLIEAGYIEGRNVLTEYRLADGQLDRLPMLAAELVRHEVAVLVSGGSDATRAAKNATASIPIVFMIGNDPVQTGLVVSLNRPGRNITGATLMTREIQGKRLAITREILPNASTIATLTNPTSVVADFNLGDLEAAAARIGQRLLVLKAGSDSEIEEAFVAIVRHGANALFVNSNPFFGNRRDLIVLLAARHRIPTVFADRGPVESGGLMSYGSSLADSYRQAGLYTGRILNGEKPGELPVMQPSKFELIINLKTAKTLGLTVPTTLRALADEVIE